MGAGTYFIHQADGFSYLVGLCQCFRILQQYIGIANQRPVGMTTAPANQAAFLKLIVFTIAVESGSTFIQPEVSSIRALFLQRPAELFTDLVGISGIVRLVAIYRDIRGNDCLLQTWVAVVIRLFNAGFVTAVQVVFLINIFTYAFDKGILL